MTNVFEELTKVLIPPARPVATGTPDGWAAVEARIGRLPGDYKRFIDTYGVGVINDWVWILSPFEPAGRGTLESRLTWHKESHALGLFEDEPDGLIPWADNEDRGMCFWETEEPNPDRWTVLAMVEDDLHRWPENMTMFLLKILRGAHRSAVFGHDTRYTLPLHYKAWVPGDVSPA